MLWAACCLAFFGFLHIGEMTVPSDSKYDPAVHLRRQDLAVDNPKHPGVVRVRIKQSKTDSFQKGVDLFLCRSSSDFCPVTVAAIPSSQGCGGPSLHVFKGIVLDQTAFRNQSEGGAAEGGSGGDQV